MALTPCAKTLYDYLCDNCDNAGFIEYTPMLWMPQLRMTRAEIIQALTDIKDKLCSAKQSNTNKLWLKGHLFWQGYLPLSVENDEHKWIINRLEASLEKFNHPPEMVKILA